MFRGNEVFILLKGMHGKWHVLFEEVPSDSWQLSFKQHNPISPFPTGGTPNTFHVLNQYARYPKHLDLMHVQLQGFRSTKGRNPQAQDTTMCLPSTGRCER